MRAWVFGLEGCNILVLLFMLFVMAQPVHAQGTAAASMAQNQFLGAAIAVGLAAIGAGIAVGISGAAAIGAVAEKPELLGRTLIFVGLAEGIVIYGLIISFIILRG
jgi:V/A-type H+/Na+-transporting ATPase subunit K